MGSNRTCSTYEHRGRLDLERQCHGRASYFLWHDRLGAFFSCDRHLPKEGLEGWQPVSEWDEERYQALVAANEERMNRIFPGAKCE